jgi:hypothetical protein
MSDWRKLTASRMGVSLIAAVAGVVIPPYNGQAVGPRWSTVEAYMAFDGREA